MGYPSDLTDAQWELIKDYFAGSRRRKYDKRSLVNEVLYLVKTGCQWRMPPNDFSPYRTMYSFYRRMRINGTWEAIMDGLVRQIRVKAGRNATPSYSIIDSQSVKTTSASD